VKFICLSLFSTLFLAMPFPILAADWRQFWVLASVNQEL